MKRTPIARRTPLRRTRMKRKPRRRMTSEAAREYMLWIREKPCAARYLGECDAGVDADHQGRRGLGSKASDFSCVPMCPKHHKERHELRGPWSMMDKDERRGWCDAQIINTQMRWKADHPGAVPPWEGLA